MQLWSVNYKPPSDCSNTGIYQCIEHFGDQKSCIENKIDWFLKDNNHLVFGYRIGKATMGKILAETSETIFQTLKDQY